MRTIVFYRTQSGKCPIEEFLNELSGKEAQKVAWVVKLIEDLDFTPSNYLKNLVNTDSILEIRVQMGKNIFRLLGFKDIKNSIVLTNGFQKKTQETPSREIKLAEKRKNEYLKRRGKK